MAYMAACIFHLCIQMSIVARLLTILVRGPAKLHNVVLQKLARAFAVSSSLTSQEALPDKSTKFEPFAPRESKRTDHRSYPQHNHASQPC